MPLARPLLSWTPLLLVAIVLTAVPEDRAHAHGGGLDSNGGHYNRKTGGYHCHRCPCGCAKPTPAPKKTKPSPKPTSTPNEASKNRCSIEVFEGKAELEIGIQTTVTLVTGVTFTGELMACSAQRLELGRTQGSVTVKAVEIKSASQ